MTLPTTLYCKCETPFWYKLSRVETFDRQETKPTSASIYFRDSIPKFPGYKFSRLRVISVQFSDFYANFDSFSMFLISISRMTPKVRFSGYKLSPMALIMRFCG